MEEHLPSFRGVPIFIRSLYLHQNDFVAEVYPTGLLHFYRLMYPLGPVEGFYEVGLSFLHSGFTDKAREAFLQASEVSREQIFSAEIRPGTQRRRDLGNLLPCLRMKLRRLGVAPAQVAPAQVAPAQVAPAQVAPAQVAPAQVAHPQVAHPQVDGTQALLQVSSQGSVSGLGGKDAALPGGTEPLDVAARG